MALLSQGGHSTGLCSLNSIPWIFMSSVVYFFFLLLSFFLFTRSLFLFLWALRTCQVGHFDSHLFWYLNEFFNENLVLTGGRYNSSRVSLHEAPTKNYETFIGIYQDFNTSARSYKSKPKVSTTRN